MCISSGGTLESKQADNGNITGTFQSVHTRLSVPTESTRAALKPEPSLAEIRDLCSCSAHSLPRCLGLYCAPCSSVALIDFPYETRAEDLPSSIFILGLDLAELPAGFTSQVVLQIPFRLSSHLLPTHLNHFYHLSLRESGILFLH